MTRRRGGFAVIGSDGLRPVVWGIGASKKAALRDAKRWDAPSDLDTHPITVTQRARIQAGDVGWPISKKPLKHGLRERIR